jgi:hypothetical protein
VASAYAKVSAEADVIRPRRGRKVAVVTVVTVVDACWAAPGPEGRMSEKERGRRPLRLPKGCWRSDIFLALLSEVSVLES